MRILLVDDDEFSLEITSNLLTEDGHDIEIARDGQQALDALQRQAYRMMITDWEMPVMNGLELCRAVRRNESLPYVYTILVTSRDRTEDVVVGMQAGADDFVSKPFEAAELRVRIAAGRRMLALENKDLAIFAMAKLAESRDSETGAHLERVRSYSKALAIAVEHHPKFRDTISPEFINMIFETSPLHDIGKIGIPDSVLLKPGRLTDAEFEIMKQHTVIGAEALDATIQQYENASFLRMARDIVLTHHERYDGTGYPNGLVGEEIPLPGRIVAIADAYDALRSKRVYKDAFGHHVTREILLEGRGTQFDPDLIDTFINIEDEFAAIHDRFSKRAMVMV